MDGRLRSLLDDVACGRRLESADAVGLAASGDLPRLMKAASALRDAGHHVSITYSRKVFIPLTQLCRDVCHYCTFAQRPDVKRQTYLNPEQVLAIARAGAAAGCREALFTLGDKPELRYQSAREGLSRLGYDSTLAYLAAMCRSVFEKTGLLPHVNPGTMSADEIALLRNQRIAGEKRVQQLTAELQNLQELQRAQAHPRNLIVVKKSHTPIYAKNAESSRVLFEAAASDEFEFLDEEGEWIHITISGDSRGFVRKNSAELPEGLAARLQSAVADPEEKFPGFRIEREETGDFPGDWTPLKGRKVKIFTVQPLSQNPKEAGPTARLNYCLALFEKGLREGSSANPGPEGVVVIFDAADGGIAAATSANIQKLSTGSLKGEAFWQQGYLDPPDAFAPAPK